MAGQSKRGFAAMGPQQQQEIARRGGQAAHKKGTAHEFTPEEARIAGRRGGKAISRDREYMAKIGRKGGQNSGRRAEKSKRPDSVTYGGGEPGGQSPNAAENAHHVAATALLRADHRRVEDLFSQYERDAGQSAAAGQVISQICQELEIHTRIEEEIFYPTVRNASQEIGHNLLADALKEHRAVKLLTARLRDMRPEDEAYEDIVRQLKEGVGSHVREEENEMMPKAEDALGEQLEAVGAQLRRRRQELLNSPPEPSPGAQPAPRDRPIPSAEQEEAVFHSNG